jgi:NitT/TauT family transport system substrate-binding protein
MYYMRKWLIALLSVLAIVMSACSPTSYDRLKLSTLSWIGYTPLFYAKAQGWLDEYNIELIQVVSLSENMYLFEAGNTDAFVATQYEYSVLAQDMADLVPVLMINRSNGGDVVLGNRDLDDYRVADIVDVYLEIDSINQLVLRDFIARYGLDSSRFNLIDADPLVTSLLNAEESGTPTLIITYNPYDIILQRQGFHELASTRGSLDLLVVDAMYTRTGTLSTHRAQFEALKSMLDEALGQIRTNPMAVYVAVQPYIQGINSEEFLQALSVVEWLDQRPDPVLAGRLHDQGFPTGVLLD